MELKPWASIFLNLWQFLAFESKNAGTSVLRKINTFCGFPWVETSTAGRVYDLCVYYMTGAPEGSPKVVFYVALWFYGEAGNRTCDPWFTRHSAYPLHHGGFTVLDQSISLQGTAIYIYKLILNTLGIA